MNFFKKKKIAYWAIEVTSTTFRAALYFDNQVVDVINDEKNLSENFRKLKEKDSGAVTKKNISLNGYDTIIRYFPFPKMDRKATKDAIFYELNKHIPFDPNDVYFDFDILDDSQAKENIILLGIIKKKIADAVLAEAASVGVELADVSLSAVNLMNLVRKKEEKRNSCIFNVSDRATSIIILQNGLPVITREASVGADKLVKEVMNRCKSSEGLTSEKEAAITDEFWPTLSQTPEIFVKEMKTTFDYFELNKGAKIEKIYLAGKVMDYPGAVKFFNDNFETEAELLNDFSFLNIKDESKQKFQLCEFSTIAGMLV